VSRIFRNVKKVRGYDGCQKPENYQTNPFGKIGKTAWLKPMAIKNLD